MLCVSISNSFVINLIINKAINGRIIKYTTLTKWMTLHLETLCVKLLIIRHWTTRSKLCDKSLESDRFDISLNIFGTSAYRRQIVSIILIMSLIKMFSSRGPNLISAVDDASYWLYTQPFTWTYWFWSTRDNYSRTTKDWDNLKDNNLVKSTPWCILSNAFDTSVYMPL